MKNHAFTTRKSLPSVEAGHVFDGYNFSRITPHTKIFDGIAGLTFRKCNLLNCDIPADATVEDCLRIHKDFCTNLHPEFVAHGLSQCPENCSHVTDIDEIWIDGVLVDAIYSYGDKVI